MSDHQFAATGEREKFEAWAREYRGGFTLDRFKNGDYVHYNTRDAWECWQARAAIADISPVPSAGEWVTETMEIARQYAHAYFNHYANDRVCITGDLAKFEARLLAHLGKRPVAAEWQPIDSSKGETNASKD